MHLLRKLFKLGGILTVFLYSGTLGAITFTLDDTRNTFLLDHNSIETTRLSSNELLHSVQNLSDQLKPIDENSGIGDATWYVFKLKNTSKITEKWFFKTGVVQPELFRIITQKEENYAILLDYTVKDSFHQRPETNRRLLATPFKLEKQEILTIYVQYRGIANFPLRLEVVTRDTYQKETSYFDLVAGAILGVLLVIFLFFLFQSILMPSWTKIYFSCFVFSMALFTAQIIGITFKFIWPDLPLFNFRFISVSGCLTYVWYYLFTSSIFNLKTNNYYLYICCQLFALTAIAFSIIGLFINMSTWIAYFALLALPVPVVVGIWAKNKKLPSSSFFIVGSSTHCTSAYIFTLAILGVSFDQQHNAYTFAQLGQLFDLIIFAASIIYQSKIVQKELYERLNQNLKDAEALVQLELEKSQSYNKLQDNILQIAAISHDLIHPIASLKMTLSVVDEEKNALVKKKMGETVNYAEEILKTLIVDSKNEILANEQKIDLNLLLTEVKQRYQASFDNKKIRLRIKTQETHIVASNIILNRIVDNLLSNSLRNIEKGGILITIRKRKEMNNVLLQIWDTGKGMDKDTLKKLNSNEWKVNHNTPSKEGYGLGLIIIISLCQSSGYEYFVNSKLNRGTCFSILIPKKPVL